MERQYGGVAAAIAAVTRSAGGMKIMKIYLGSRPINLGGQAFKDVSDCARTQKKLFGYIEAYKERHGEVPDSIETLVNDDLGCAAFDHCPLVASYVIHPEAYGDANSVLISKAENKHRSTFEWWMRGWRPCPQTMGASIVWLFEDGKVATIDARKKAAKNGVN